MTHFGRIFFFGVSPRPTNPFAFVYKSHRELGYIIPRFIGNHYLLVLYDELWNCFKHKQI